MLLNFSVYKIYLFFVIIAMNKKVANVKWKLKKSVKAYL